LPFLFNRIGKRSADPSPGAAPAAACSERPAGAAIAAVTAAPTAE
jgi:hypothetical protein